MRKQRAIGDLVDMSDPSVFRVHRGFDALEPLFPQIFEATRNPVHVLFDGHHHIGHHRRAARTGDDEHVRETGHHDAEVAARPFRPLLLQRDAGLCRGYPCYTACPSARRSRWRTRCCPACTRPSEVRSPVGSHLFDRRRPRIDQGDVVAIEGRIVIRVHAKALGRDGIVSRHQCLGNGGSRTIPRILARTNSAAVSLASLLKSRSPNAPIMLKPP